ncbi:hypothetical protein bcgnr5380_27340 [Bacillus cereus]
MEDIPVAYKLSQNRNEKDYINIIEELYDEGNPDAKQMVELMGSRLKNHILSIVIQLSHFKIKEQTGAFYRHFFFRM